MLSIQSASVAKKENMSLRNELSFLEMNGQSDLTLLVKAVTDHVTTNPTSSERNASTLREDNAMNVAVSGTSCDFDNRLLQFE